MASGKPNRAAWTAGTTPEPRGSALAGAVAGARADAAAGVVAGARAASVPLPSVRRQLILSMLEQRQFLTHHEIRAVTGCSLGTVRRDVILLEKAGTVVRVRGGITRPASLAPQWTELTRLLNRALASARLGDVDTAERMLRLALDSCARQRRRGTAER